MIDFSISSVNMSILVSNLFIIFLVLIFRNRKVMFRLGLPLLVGFVILICVRTVSYTHLDVYKRQVESYPLYLLSACLFPEVDPLLGPEMRSTGEVLGLADTVGAVSYTHLEVEVQAET